MNVGYGLLQGLAAGAGSLVHSIDTQEKEAAEQRAADRKLADAERLKAIEEVYATRAEERKRAMALKQGKDIQAGATGLLNSGVATKINSTLGSSIDPNNPDSAATLEAIRNNPAAAKAYGLEPEDDLTKAKARGEAARNIGDLGAARELDTHTSNLRKEKADEKKGDRDEARLDEATRHNKATEERQLAVAEAQTRLLETRERNAQKTETAATKRAELLAAEGARKATQTALAGVNTEIKALEKEAASLENMEPAKQKVVQSQLQAARMEAAGYRRSLAEAGLPAVDKPEPATGDNDPLGIRKPKKDAAPATPGATPKASAAPTGLLASSAPPQNNVPTDRIGELLDKAKADLAALGGSPQKGEDYAAWSARRKALALEVDNLQSQYEQRMNQTGKR